MAFALIFEEMNAKAAISTSLSLFVLSTHVELACKHTDETSHTEPPGDGDAVKVGECPRLQEDGCPYPGRRDAYR